ncbi:CK1 family protein kinase [Trichomonas vaginalis G3]|uniref:non-specific serine/threonine protein kinase n=1 Tax=Trichomonas vaginalis (strain ATCC PRA-98 / G3) TaxID=412133 RepID=A2FQE6_TRIV3|nr:STKc CK1 domain-containing protein [Trichomonas vaginalis G3]EAX92854.1 CK1 family protein kinase [Trichomonas vaginalis G3]KAI5515793.1 STKc CK1 domain-containing protein [Trichomonas vaginalis G3]|eukprot:XP_001305784.1 CK1 family protein kinase [Trichomonas vaginalis G3]
MDLRVGQKYSLKKKVGGGSFGEIYYAENVDNNEKVAVKLEAVYTRPSQIANEKKLYTLMAGGAGIPKVYWSGREGDYNVLVMELLGDSLEDCFNKCKRKLSLKTVLMITLQLLSRIEYIHSKGYLHRDIKPENFLVGLRNNANVIYAIDFGISSRYIDFKTHQHIEYREGRPMTGTARYASINTHIGIEPSRRDDLEAIAYMIIYLLKGSLPWQNVKAATKKDKYDAILQKKLDTPSDVLCAGIPREFKFFLDDIRRLDFTDTPHYSLYREIFKDLFVREGFCYDDKYDWCNLALQSSSSLNHILQAPKQVSQLQKSAIDIISDNSRNKNVRRVKMSQYISTPAVKPATRIQTLI